MKKTIVLVRNLAYDFINTYDYENKDLIEEDNERVIISEPVEVDFVMLQEKDLTDKRVAMIDKQISKVRASLHQLEQQKQELLSLPAPE